LGSGELISRSWDSWRAIELVLFWMPSGEISDTGETGSVIVVEGKPRISCYHELFNKKLEIYYPLLLWDGLAHSLGDPREQGSRQRLPS
jgi:hypothetical protein